MFFLNQFTLKVICFLSLTFFLIYLWFRKRYRYWSAKKVKGPKPSFPFGNVGPMLKNNLHMGAWFRNVYEKTKHLPYAGVYLFHRPAMLINNMDLIKMILVKDFIHFTDHGIRFNKKTQPLANHLFNLRGAVWKGIRNKLTPAFTSSKMKYMFDTIASCGDEMKDYLESFADHSNEVDIKDIIAKYSTDVISSCAFGIDSNSFKYPDAEFRKMGKRVFDFDLRRKMVMFMLLFLPEIQDVVDGHMLEKCVTDFFENVIRQSVEYREKNNIQRNDLLQLLIRLKNNEDIDDIVGDPHDLEAKENETLSVQLSLLELTAQAFGFFAAGFETSSTATTFIFYNLLRHGDVLRKLVNEIDHVLVNHKGKITYEALNDMAYIDQIIRETLRLTPPIPLLFRVCTKEYKIPHTNVTIEKGTPVFIPTWGIHMDPDIYPDPEKWDPDRFSPEMSNTRHHFSFLTFGEGPRICIGNRFALLQIKIALVSILRHYEIQPGADSDNFEILNNSFLFTPKNMNVVLKKRQIPF